ncbi:hypothetical protein [Cyanobium sp. ATX 6F1]|nr:hypothetical protein [Cyanobium sp. ATX 6F1]MCP9916345.1 hypothetical protein [Cyanobium sp. ATX 6F1]
MEKVPAKKENLVQVNETGLGETEVPENAQIKGIQLGPRDQSTGVQKSI